MADFKCVTDTISEIKDVLDKVQEILEDTYNQALDVQGALTNQENWSGEAQLVGAAFLDLVVQYHGKLSPEMAPINCARRALYQYLLRDESFYEEWSEYQDIMSM